MYWGRYVMPTTLINGATIHYEEIGSGIPVILTPGGRQPGNSLLALATDLSQDHRVILWDRRNCGASDVVISGDRMEHQIWADDLVQLLHAIDAFPAYIGGTSAGVRTALLVALRHPDAVKGLLLYSVSGGEYAAQNLGDSYYDEFVRVAEKDGMAGVVASEFWSERIAENPSNKQRLLDMEVDDFIAVMRYWRSDFTAEQSVIGVADSELRTISAPTSLIYVDDLTHTGTANNAVARNLPNCEQHPGLWTREDTDSWSADDPELSRKNQAALVAPVFRDFLARVEA